MKTSKNKRKESIAPTVDDLISDHRLERLLSKNSHDCALQLWILQIRHEQEIENRVIYGRLLPYSYSNNSWSAPQNDNFSHLEQVQAQVIRLNLYVKSDCCGDILRQLSDGQTISTISERLELKLSKKLKKRFGSTVLLSDSLIYRPVAYLLNRDAYEKSSLSSPHSSAGALSASLVQADKQALLSFGGDYTADLADLVVKHLNADTGLDFGSSDTIRLGDLELLVFPTLDDKEQPLLKVHRETSPCCALIVLFDPRQVPHFSGFLLRLSISNSAQILHSGIATAERNEGGLFECQFELSDQLNAITNSTELEIFGFDDNQPHRSTLCCRYKVYYLREISIQMNAVGSTIPVKFDWLERTTRPSVSKRVSSALTLNRDSPDHINRVGGREADSWVSVNSNLTSLFERIHPPKSEGAFFQRWGQGDGEGRLQFVEWFRALLGKYQQQQVIIFDPYFEDVGLSLVLLRASSQANYIVFTSLPKKNETAEGNAEEPTRSRINNLMANCEHNRRLLQHIKLRIYGLKNGRLHDRYILIMGQDNLPVAGYHLSNSFQKIAENFPLLVTPIPADVLLKVEQYKSLLIKEAQALEPEETENSRMRLLFDSTAPSSTPQQRYEPLTFLENTQAGDVLSVWTEEQLLQGLYGDQLKKQMVTLNMLRGNSLVLTDPAGLIKCLDHQMGGFDSFTDTWELLGEVLAHSPAGNERFSELEHQHDFISFLGQFLTKSFYRHIYAKEATEWSVVGDQLFKDSIEPLLYSSQRPEHFAQMTKYAALTWSEYYTIKYLWWYAPNALLTILESEVSHLSEESQNQDIIRLSLLSQAISEIALGMQFEISERHCELLVRSSNGLLQWMGLNVLESQLEKSDGQRTVFKLMNTLHHTDQLRNLGWMIHRAAKDKNKTEIYQHLIERLHSILPTLISQNELKSLIDSMRGHMKQLTWAEPWLFRDIIWPLVESECIKTDDACGIWTKELHEMLEPKNTRNNPLIFDRERDGQTINTTAFLFANASTSQQQVSLDLMESILERQERIINQPLASTSNWSRWDNALGVSMWILAFTRWSHYYLYEGRVNEFEQLEELSQAARDLAMSRSMYEWRSIGGQQKSLVEFLNQAEELIGTD